MLCLTKESVITATLVHAPVCVCVCVWVCVCAPRPPRGGLSDTSALEISSGGGSGFNSLPVDFEKPWNSVRARCTGQMETLEWIRDVSFAIEAVLRADSL